MDPLTLDPRKSGDQITSAFLSMLYEGLTRLTPDGSSEFALAESLEILDEGRTYVFTLREAYWSNGDPIEAKDFEVSWKQSLDPKFPNPCRHLFYLLKGAEKAASGLLPLADVGVSATGPRTLKIELETSSPHFLSLTSLTNFSPVSPFLQTKVKNTEWIDPAMIPVSGPFRLSSWQKRESIQLRKNALYWDHENVTLQEAKIYICKNPYLITHMFDDGEIDLISNLLCSVPRETLQRYTNSEKAQSIPMGGTTFCSFNNESLPFQNKNIRAAFSLAIDREWLAQETGCFKVPATRLLPPPLAKNPVSSRLEFNRPLAVQKLRQGMKELGIFGSGEPDQLNVHCFFENLTLSFENSVERSKVAHALQKQWKQVLKLQVKLDPSDYQSHLQKLYSGSYSMGLGYWLTQYMDPLDIFERFKNKEIAKNYPRFENKKYANIVQRISQETDRLTRNHLLQQAEELLMEETPIAPLYHYDHLVVARHNFDNISYLPNGSLRFTSCHTTPTPSIYEKPAALG
jgi:oligopeptide transport system substrate-binding protein